MVLISLAHILLSCFSGVFSTPVNHLITKLSCSWLEHANVSVEQLNFISGWADFMTAFCSWEVSSVWEQRAQGCSAEVWKHPWQALPLSSCPISRTPCPLSFHWRWVMVFTSLLFPSCCFPSCSCAALTGSCFRLHCVLGKSAPSPQRSVYLSV